ncbi:MAG: hypothetical protein RL220_942 [Bacteroidota bacterium]
MSLNLLIVDDHQIVIDGLKALLSDQSGVDLKGEAHSGDEAIQILGLLKIDLVLLDIDMPGENGLKVLARIKKQWPAIKVVMLTMHDEKAMIRAALDNGADGYLLKNCSRDELLSAFGRVMSGEHFLSADAHTKLLAPDAPEKRSGLTAELTEREIEILKYIAEGMSNKEIGDKLFISHRTVDTHRTNLMQKLGIHNVAGMVRFAIKEGLIE